MINGKSKHFEGNLTVQRRTKVRGGHVVKEFVLRGESLKPVSKN